MQITLIYFFLLSNEFVLPHILQGVLETCEKGLKINTCNLL